MKMAIRNTVIRGLGWLDDRAWGLVRQHRRKAYGEGDGPPPWTQGDLFSYPVRKLGRFDAVSRMTICACALALKDAGVCCGEGQKQDIGLIGSNEAGSQDANAAYFKDYLQAGRVSARGNLFVYTLASSPLAEAAIHFGLEGPLFYVGFPGCGLVDLLDEGVRLIADGEAAGMLAVRADEREAIAFLLGSAEGRGMAVREAANLIRAGNGIDERVGELALRMEERL